MSVVSEPRGSRGLLRDNRNFRLLFTADSASQVGAQILLFSLPLVALTVLGASPAEVGWLAACGTAPLPLLGLLLGACVDRMRSRPLMVAADLSGVVLLTSVPVAWWAGWLTMQQLYVVAFSVGSLTALYDIAYLKLVPDIVERSQLVAANSSLRTIQGAAYVAGPALGGFLVQVVSAPIALIGVIFGHGWSAAMVSCVRGERVPPRPGRGNLGKEIAEGLRYLLRHRLLRSVMACSATLNFFVSLGMPMTIVFLSHDLRLDSRTIGVVLACSGLGGIAGGLLSAKLTRSIGVGRVICASAAVLGMSGLLIPLARPGWLLVIVAGGLLAGSIGRFVYNVTVLSVRQSMTPDAMMGRVGATSRVLLNGSIPVSNALSGVLSGLIGTRAVLWVSAAGATAACLWVLLSPVRSIRLLPEESEP